MVYSQQADYLIQRAMSTVGLSQVPKAIRGDVGIESVLQISLETPIPER